MSECFHQTKIVSQRRQAYAQVKSERNLPRRDTRVMLADQRRGGRDDEQVRRNNIQTRGMFVLLEHQLTWNRRQTSNHDRSDTP